MKRIHFFAGIALMVSPPAFATIYECEGDAFSKKTEPGEVEMRKAQGKGLVEVGAKVVALKDDLLIQPQPNRIEVMLHNHYGYLHVEAKLRIDGLDTPALEIYQTPGEKGG